jgi:aminopeptidase N
MEESAAMVAFEDATRAPDTLTEQEAVARARRVSGLAYRLELDLAQDAEDFRGRLVATFDAVPGPEPLFLDFRGRVVELRVAGQRLEADHRDDRLWLPGELLGRRSVIEVDYENAFDRAGNGFHRFVDPEDGAAYVHTDFEPFAAHRVFPCFDQPDLKATYELTVTAPAPWQVVSAERLAEARSLPDGRVRHRFARTPPFSTYLLAIIGGPYVREGIESGGVPLGVYARSSMEPILRREAPEILEVTAQGLEVFRRIFGHPYPFTKYDQLFVPEFNSGAMENVAAVTFHDRFLFRDPPTEAQRLERAEVVLHELAHMWFGDLVTMRWWDDLWLNESFATWAAFHALATGTRFRDAWKRFNGVMKPAAYRADQLVTSHPVAAHVPDTTAALLNFDSIVYEKGASVLRQLVATIGGAAFEAGLQRYVERHRWGNATFAEFLEALEEAAGRPLGPWADAWIGSSGLDTVTVRWGEADGTITDLAIRADAPGDRPASRTHALQLGLVIADGDQLRIEVLPVLVDGEARVPAAVGMPAPALAFPNHGDHDYARALLDPRSLDFALHRIGELDDPLFRQLLWSTLWDMARDAHLPMARYLDAVRRLAPDEPDADLVDAILGHAVTALRRYVPEPDRGPTAARFIDDALAVADGSRGGDLRRVWMRAAIAAAPDAVGTGALGRLLAIVDGPGRDDTPLDQELRWQLAVTACAAGAPDADRRLAAEVARDPSDRGVRARIRADAARPDAATKATTWERIVGDGWGSLHLTRAAMQGFLWPGQRALLAPYRDRFFATVRLVFATRDHPFARAWFSALFPGLWGEPEVIGAAERILETLEPREANLARHLREAIDDLERVIRVREGWASGGSTPARPGTGVEAASPS